MTHGSLPEQYGETRFVAMVRGPDSLFAYWELTGDVRAAHSHCAWCIRLRDPRTDQTHTEIIDPDVGHWYLHTTPGQVCFVELGTLDATGSFHRVAKEGPLQTPPQNLGPLAGDEEWLLSEEYARLFAIWGGPDFWSGSPAGLSARPPGGEGSP